MSEAKPSSAFNNIVVYGLLERDEKYLFLKRQNTSYQPGMYGLPAGKLEPGETLTQGLRRELKEEIGVDVTAPELKPIYLSHRVPDSYLHVIFAIDDWAGEPTNMEPEKCSELSWHPKDRLPQKLIPFLRYMIADIQAGNSFSEHEVEQ